MNPNLRILSVFTIVVVLLTLNTSDAQPYDFMTKSVQDELTQEGFGDYNFTSPEGSHDGPFGSFLVPNLSYEETPFAELHEPQANPHTYKSQTCGCKNCECNPCNCNSKYKEPSKRMMIFGAPWCGPCIQQDNVLLNKINDLAPKGTRWEKNDTPISHIQKINGDLRPDLVQKYKVTAYPTAIYLHNGVEVGRHEGAILSYSNFESQWFKYFPKTP